MKVKYSTYLFDFDGTLVDSMPFWMQKMLNVLEKSKVDYPDDIIKIITPLGDLGTARYFKEKLGVDFSIEEMLSMMNEYALPKYRDVIKLKDGVLDFLTELKERQSSLNILTASPHSMLDPCLKRNGIYDLFDNVWSSDDFKMSKSDPLIYKKVAEKLDKPVDSIVFFDDNYNADKAAKVAGMAVCGVYDSSSEEYIDEIKGISDYYIYNFSEFLKFIK